MLSESVPEGLPSGREFMIQSPSPDWIIRAFPQRSLRLRGDLGVSRQRYSHNYSSKMTLATCPRREASSASLASSRRKRRGARGVALTFPCFIHRIALTK
jgi:hypothetical protein